jgi:hypothetical protein
LDSLPRDLSRQVEDDRQFGNKSLSGNLIHLPDLGRIDAAGVTLVNDGREAEAIANHPFTPRQCRADFLCDKLSPRGHEQHDFGYGRDLQTVFVEQYLPHRQTERRASGVAESPDWMLAVSFEPAAGGIDLRRLACTINSVEYDQHGGSSRAKRIKANVWFCLFYRTTAVGTGCLGLTICGCDCPAKPTSCRLGTVWKFESANKKANRLEPNCVQVSEI